LAGIGGGNQARFFSPSEKKFKNVAFYHFNLDSGDNMNGTYICNMTMPKYSETGKWHLSYFHLLDNVNNDLYLNETAMELLGFPTVIEVKS
jgi:hypothetical protein